MTLGILVASENTGQYPADFLHGPPLKMKNSKIGLCHVLSWSQHFMTVGLLVGSENMHKHTDRQD